MWNKWQITDWMNTSINSALLHVHDWSGIQINFASPKAKEIITKK